MEIAWPVIDAGAVAAQPQHRRRHLFRLDEAALRIGRGEACARLLGAAAGLLDDALDRFLQHVGFDEARADRVDGDAGLGGFGGQRPHQADDAVLGRDIGRDIGVALQAGGRGDEDDAAASALRHAGQRRLHGQERAGQVDVERALPVGERGPVRRCAAGHAGIGDDDVERAARCLGLLVKRRHRRFVGDVGGDAEDALAFAGHRLQRCLAPAADGDVDAGAGQRQRDRLADAGAAAVTSACAADDHTFSPIVALRSASR